MGASAANREAPAADAVDGIRADIRELCSFDGRLAGTDAERRAANRFAGRLRDIGRRVEVEPTYVHPQAPLVWAAHCLIGFAGSLTASAEPAVGFALVLVASMSLYLDLNGRIYLLRSLFFRRASQNVVSPGASPDAPARLIIAAHLDAGRTGAIFDERNRRRIDRFSRLLGVAPSRLVFWALIALLPLLGARMAGIDSGLIPAFQLPSTLILLVAIFLLVDVQLSSPSPGANDNASGVAVALDVAARLAEDSPKNLDVWIVLTGAQEPGAEGMRSFVRARRDELDPASTFLLALDAVGRGDLRFVTAEGPAVSYLMDRRLTELAGAIAEADRDGGARYRAAPLRRASASDAFAAAARGWRALAITCLEPGATLPPGHHTHADTPDAIDPRSLESTREFTLELVRALDADVARASA
jgi:hypothetical protein